MRCNAPLRPMIPCVAGRPSRAGQARDLGDRLEDPLRRDAVGRPDRLREERDPQLLDHPADLDDLGRAALGRAQRVEQVGVAALDEVDLLEGLGVAGEVGGRLVEAVGDRPQVAVEVGQPAQSPCRRRSPVGRARAAAPGRRRASAGSPGCSSGRARRGGSSGRGAWRGSARRGRRPARPWRVVWVRTADSAHSKSSRVRTAWSARSVTASSRIASTAAARQSSSRAGTLPCGLWPRASFWVLVRRARICFHGGRDAEQEQPPHAEPVLGVGLGPGRQHPQVDAPTRCRRGPGSPGRPRRSRRSRAPRRRGRPSRPARSTPDPGAAHLPAQLRRWRRRGRPRGPCPSRRARPSGPSTLKVTCRWGGTRSTSKSVGRDGAPRPGAAATVASAGEQRPARRVELGQRRRARGRAPARGCGGSPWGGSGSAP